MMMTCTSSSLVQDRRPGAHLHIADGPRHRVTIRESVLTFLQNVKTAEALRRLDAGTVRGKIVVDVQRRDQRPSRR